MNNKLHEMYKLSKTDYVAEEDDEGGGFQGARMLEIGKIVSQVPSEPPLFS